MKIGEVWIHKQDGYWAIIKDINNDYVSFTIWPCDFLKLMSRAEFIIFFQKNWEFYEMFKEEMEYMKRKLNENR